MHDAFSRYEVGLSHLLAELGGNHQRYAEALTLQARLLDNIAQARCYGDTETRRAERAQIVEALNQLALQGIGKSFHEFTKFTNVDSDKLQLIVNRARETGKSLRSTCNYLRGLCDFPPKQVIDDLFLVLEQTAQLIEDIKEQRGYEDLSLQLRIKEMLAEAESQLQHCRTQARILKQLNGKWNMMTGIPDTDPIEKFLVCLDELADLLDKIVILV
jgi:hypothetical protein